MFNAFQGMAAAGRSIVSKPTDDLLAAGEVEACTIWKWIARAIERLQATAPVAGEAVH